MSYRQSQRGMHSEEREVESRAVPVPVAIPSGKSLNCRLIY